jgi:hypothetical protein
MEILLISASQVARITSLRHWWLAHFFNFLENQFSTNLGSLTKLQIEVIKERATNRNIIIKFSKLKTKRILKALRENWLIT